MATLKFIFVNFVVTIALLACTGFGSAQQRPFASENHSFEGGPAVNPASQTVTLNSVQKQELNFIVRVTGSVTGRVFDEMEQTEAGKTARPHGISGVKVTLRSRDPGFERFMIEQFTDVNGKYDFQYLRPGKYAIEIDPVSLPSDYRTPEAAEYGDNFR